MISSSSKYCLPETTKLPTPEHPQDSIYFTEQGMINALCNLDPNTARKIENIAIVI